MIKVGIGGWTFEPWRGVFYPDKLPQTRELAYAACGSAGAQFALGNAGAGLGARAGNLKGGLGSASAVDPASGEVTRVWDAFDTLDPTKREPHWAGVKIENALDYLGLRETR